MISGLIGGIAAVVLLTYLSARLRSQPASGTLRWGWGLALLGSCCLAFLALPIGAIFYDNDVWTNSGAFLPVISLLVVFGFGAVGCFVEYFLVRGKYDDQGIEFHTPWTGTKIEKWRDLQTAEFSKRMSWYVLRFQSGSTIRLSNLLSGHVGVIERLHQMGFDLE